MPSEGDITGAQATIKNNFAASSPPYQNIGCFKDDPMSPAIETLEERDSILDGNYTTRNDSITKCFRAAKKRGFHIFAVQDGGRCASNASAANTFDKYGNSSDCESDGKGGQSANQVYYITGKRIDFSYAQFFCHNSCIPEQYKLNQQIYRPPLKYIIVEGGFDE